MNYEHKTNLKKALISQTCNENLTSKLVSKIEENSKKPKQKIGPSLLQLAIEKEKGKSSKSKTYNSEVTEE